MGATIVKYWTYYGVAEKENDGLNALDLST
jgi:hypothetical protein